MEMIKVPITVYEEYLSLKSQNSVISINEALTILGCSRRQFFVLKSEKETFIRTASVRGKYIKSSIEKEKHRVR